MLSELTRLIIPRAVVRPRPFQYLQVPALSGGWHTRLVLIAAVRPRPLQHFQSSAPPPSIRSATRPWEARRPRLGPRARRAHPIGARRRGGGGGVARRRRRRTASRGVAGGVAEVCGRGGGVYGDSWGGCCLCVVDFPALLLDERKNNIWMREKIISLIGRAIAGSRFKLRAPQFVSFSRAPLGNRVHNNAPPPPHPPPHIRAPRPLPPPPPWIWQRGAARAWSSARS
jgi:hypothetical protein